VVTRTNILWWLYVVTTLGLGYGQMIRKIMSDTGGIASRFGPPAAATIVAVGIAAMLYRQPLLRRWLWKGVFSLLVVASVGAVFLGAYLLLIEGVTSWNVALLFGLAIYAVPCEIQLHRYAFGTTIPWQVPSERSV